MLAPMVAPPPAGHPVCLKLDSGTRGGLPDRPPAAIEAAGGADTKLVPPAAGAPSPDLHTMLPDLLIALLLLAANALFVAGEFALTRLRPTQLVELERDRRVGASSLRHAVAHLDAYLAACQLGITIASIGLGVV